MTSWQPAVKPISLWDRLSPGAPGVFRRTEKLFDPPKAENACPTHVCRGLSAVRRQPGRSGAILGLPEWAYGRRLGWTVE